MSGGNVNQSVNGGRRKCIAVPLRPETWAVANGCCDGAMGTGLQDNISTQLSKPVFRDTEHTRGLLMGPQIDMGPNFMTRPDPVRPIVSQTFNLLTLNFVTNYENRVPRYESIKAAMLWLLSYLQVPLYFEINFCIIDQRTWPNRHSPNPTHTQLCTEVLH